MPRITRDEWERKLFEAQEFMKARNTINRILIEVAVQHPLIDGEFPNEEFSKRLLLGKRLYEESKEQESDVEIYVPGSRHRHEGVDDKISLSKAGVTFLLNSGLPPEILHGEDLNIRYKGEKGVYNSADECFVTSSYFKDGNFGCLYSVLSPVQLMRKALHYIWFGVVPLFYTAPTQRTFHNWIDEAYNSIPYVLNEDPDWQSEFSERANSSRKERIPPDRRIN